MPCGRFFFPLHITQCISFYKSQCLAQWLMGPGGEDTRKYIAESEQQSAIAIFSASDGRFNPCFNSLFDIVYRYPHLTSLCNSYLDDEANPPNR